MTIINISMLQEEELIPLVEKYLASIPGKNVPAVIDATKVKSSPGEFPANPVTEDVR